MTKKPMTTEEKADALLMALGKELGESRAAFGEAMLDENRPDPPMFMEPKDPWGLPVKPKKKRKTRRALLLAAVLVLSMGLVLVAAEGVKLKKSNLHMEETPGESTRIVEETPAVYDVEDFQLGYVPEGYSLQKDVTNGDVIRRIHYVDDEENGIQIFIAKTELYGANVDNETTDRETVMVNDKEAYIFHGGKTNLLTWQMGDCTVDVTAELSEAQLLQLAEELFVP